MHLGYFQLFEMKKISGINKLDHILFEYTSALDCGIDFPKEFWGQREV